MQDNVELFKDAKDSASIHNFLSGLDFIPLASAVLDKSNQLVFSNQELKKMFSRYKYSEEKIKEFELGLASAVYYVEIANDFSGLKFDNILNFGGKNYVYDLIPVIIDHLIKYKLVIIKGKRSLSGVGKDIHFNSELKNANALTTSYRQQLQAVQLEQQHTCNLIAESKSMRNVIDLAVKASSVDSPVLILGESGSGKDVIAKFIHNISERAKTGNLIKINCGAIPETLLESELFGYEPGAFTGAKSQGKIGLFELAHGGTFFLDEIGDLPLSLQVKLLDVLQEGVISRVGGTKPIPVDARIIAATNKDLEQMVHEGKFRLDLFYRLNVISIYVPALRKRKEDIIPLLEQFLHVLNNKYNSKKYFSPQALDLILQYNWPGNIRELRNIIERLVVTTEGEQITADDLPEQFRQVSFKEKVKIRMDKEEFVPDEGLNLKDYMKIVEKRYINSVLEKHGSLKDAANALGVDISTLVRKKRKYKS